MGASAKHPEIFPKEPIHRITDPIRRFLHVESASGIVLVAAALGALVAANSPAGEAFLSFWKQPFGVRFGRFHLELSLQHWINDFLMAIFFFVIGLEVKRELVVGELREMRRAVLPMAAAAGGMIVPAALYLLVQHGGPGERGWGIPMATDIAFVVGFLAVLGPRVPVGLRIMLLSLAIADDIGAIVVIAIGYTGGVDWTALALAAAAIVLIAGLMKLGIHSGGIYLILSLWLWYQVHASGVHATVAGVILGFLTPARARVGERRLGEIIDNTVTFLQGEGWGATERYSVMRRMELAARTSLSPLERFENGLHPWVAFGIMPLFALANAGVRFDLSDVADPVAIAVAAGLTAGKPLGVVLFSWLAVRTGLARLPHGVDWPAVAGGGFLAGIGFTMAIFIASLALEGAPLNAAKVGILAGSLASAACGLAVLVVFLPKPPPGARSA